MPVHTVLLDASVLYPAPLRDFLMHLALTDVVRVKWSAQIHQEWIEAVLRVRPDIARNQLERTRTLMDSHILDALVENYEHRIDELWLPDEDDRHVLAAAIEGGCDLIITFNLRDFPDDILAPLGISAQHPDLFCGNLIESSPLAVVAAAFEHRQSLKRPPKGVEEYLAALERQGLPKTAARLREYAPLL